MVLVSLPLCSTSKAKTGAPEDSPSTSKKKIIIMRDFVLDNTTDKNYEKEDQPLMSLETDSDSSSKTSRSTKKSSNSAYARPKPGTSPLGMGRGREERVTPCQQTAVHLTWMVAPCKGSHVGSQANGSRYKAGMVTLPERDVL